MKTYPLKLLAILPALILGWLIWRYGVNLPVWDEWHVPGIAIIQSVTDQITWEHWIHQHNEHRKLFPRLLFVPLARLTNWNIKYEMLVSFLLACSISFSVYHLSKITLNCSPRKRIAYLFLANLLIFSPMQWDTWLWGLEACTFVPIACITASLAIIFSQNPLLFKFLVSGILATVATFSFANGLLCWVIIFPSLIWISRKNKKKVSWIIAGWLLLFSFNLAVYFHNYVKAESSPSFLEVFVNPIKTVGYFLSFIGSPLGFHDLLSNQIIGLIVIMVFGLSCFYFLGIPQNRQLLSRAFPWILIGSYALGSGVLTTVGRVGFGLEQSLESRYITFSTYGILSLIYLLSIIAGNIKNKGIDLSSFDQLIKKTVVVLCIGLLMTYPANFSFGTYKFITVNKDRLYAKACLIFIYEIDNPECIKNQIYPKKNILLNIADQLDTMGFLQPSLVTTNNLQNISRQNLVGLNYGQFDGLSRDKNGNYIASGWSILVNSGQPSHAVILAYQTKDNVDRAFALVKPEQERKDLVETLNKRQYLKSGWSKSFAPDLIPTDAVAISAWSYDSNIGRAYKLNLVHQIER
ncbi:MAG: hypothetical protein WBM44_00940 [Waterburya sp.]